jgi:hypothetical protein
MVSVFYDFFTLSSRRIPQDRPAVRSRGRRISMRTLRVLIALGLTLWLTWVALLGAVLGAAAAALATADPVRAATLNHAADHLGGGQAILPTRLPAAWNRDVDRGNAGSADHRDTGIRGRVDTAMPPGTRSIQRASAAHPPRIDPAPTRHRIGTSGADDALSADSTGSQPSVPWTWHPSDPHHRLTTALHS